MEIVKIKPHEVFAYGYEYGGTCGDCASLELITSILYGIEQKDNIPRVNMFYEDGIYCLAAPMFPGLGEHDGGHHRLYAHFLGRYEMEVELLDLDSAYKKKLCLVSEKRRIDVKGIDIESYPEALKNNLRYDCYNVPDGLLDAKRCPSFIEIEKFISTNWDERVTTSMIIKELYK